MRNTLLLLLLLALFAGGGVLIVVAKFGTIDPCGILRAEMRQQAGREGGFGGFAASALPDSVIDTILAKQFGPMTPGRCLSLALSGAPPLPKPIPQNRVAGVVSYDGQWVADVPVQGSCPAAHMTLFVSGSNIAGSVVNSAGTFPITGQVGGDGKGNIQIGNFTGRIQFYRDRFAADYFNTCGERRAIGRELKPGRPG